MRAGGWRRAAVALAVLTLIGLTVLATAQPIANLLPERGKLSLPGHYILVEKSRYYMSADAAFVFRVDDYVVDPRAERLLPDSLASPTVYFANYQDLLTEKVTSSYPWLRLTLGVITGCPSGNCNDGWSRLSRLVTQYGWEVASHTRLHKRPPRDASDYLGALSDIEGNLTGYHVLTYIEPFGKAGPGELEALAAHGVRVVMDTIPSLPSKPSARLPIVKMHFTVKASSRLPWRAWLSLALREAEASGGVVVLYTHATSYDWDSPGDMLALVDKVAAMLEGRHVWVATAGELYSYTRIYEATRLSYRIVGDTVEVRVDGNVPGDVWKVPISIIIYTGGARVVSVEANGRPLQRLTVSWPVSKPTEGYFAGENYIVVNIVPPASVKVKIAGEAAALPESLPSIDNILVAVRAVAYLLWAPIIAKAVILYRRGRLRVKSPAGRPSGAEYAAIVPARNSAETITYSLRSLLQQSLPPALVAVVDDASTDGTIRAVAALLRALGARLERLVVEEGYRVAVYSMPQGTRVFLLRSSTHRGKAANVNAAYSLLRRWGVRVPDYVLLLDSDTVLERDTVERLVARAQSDPSIGAVAGLVLLWRPDRPGPIARAVASAFRNIGGAVVALVVRVIESIEGSATNFNGATLLLRREAFEDIGGLPEDALADDAVAAWLLNLRGWRVAMEAGAVSYTVDPGSLRGLASKAYRIAAGFVEGALRLIPKAIRARKPWVLAGIAYNALGGLPIALGVLHFAATSLLLAAGAHHATLAYKIALLVPYTPLSLALLTLISNPLGYLVLVYALGAVEALLLTTGLSLAYRGNKRVAKALKSAARYAPIFPLILWLNTLALIAALPLGVYRALRGGEAKWR